MLLSFIVKINKIKKEISKLDVTAEKAHVILIDIAQKSQELHKIIKIKRNENKL